MLLKMSTRRSSRKPISAAERVENAARKCRVNKSIEKAQQEEAFKEFVALIGANGGKVPYGAVDKLVKAYHKNGFKGVTRQNLYYRLERSKSTKNDNTTTMVGTSITTMPSSLGTVSSVTISNPSQSEESFDNQGSTTRSTNDPVVSVKNKGGRKKGSTKKAQKNASKAKQEVTTRSAMLYKEEVEQATKQGKTVSSGTLKRIINEEEEKMGLSLNTISIETVRSRIKRGNLSAHNKNQVSPLHDVEPLILEFCIRLAKMGTPLTKTTVLELANDIVSGTEVEELVADCKKLRKLQGTKLGTAWYRGFLKRYEDDLSRNKTVIKDIKRRTWVKSENFENMYQNIYEHMVEAGIAEYVEDAIKYDTGLETHYKFTHPEYLLFVDETGCNTNQLNDGKVGGELYLMPKNSGDAAAPAGATTDLHFTVLPFISGTGEPVLCAIIFKSEMHISEIPVNWKTGINLMAEDADNMKLVASGGPTCSFNGKVIPCFYGSSPKASITSQLLADMLKYLDDIGVYDRAVAHPFLLLDGHHSRMMLPYLKYICDPGHKWYSCFGVPYATHVWQVADASSLNGTYKIELAKAKRKYVEHRNVPKFEPTDIVPLVNMAFEKSFGNQKNAMKAIADRGWNPLNYNILATYQEFQKKNTVDLTIEPTTTSSVTFALPKININQGIGSYYLDRLIEGEKKSEGRKRKFEEIKQEQKTKEMKIEHVKKLTKVSSATLAANNHYTLDETILELVVQKHEQEEAAQKAVEMRKKAAEQKKEEFLKKALGKFYDAPSTLTVPDLKALVTAATQSTDSPVKSKKVELQQQLYREPRLGRVQAMSNNLQLTLTNEAAQRSSDAAEALLGLINPSQPTQNLTAV